MTETQEAQIQAFKEYIDALIKFHNTMHPEAPIDWDLIFTHCFHKK